MCIRDRINHHKVLRTSLAFVENTDFYSNRKHRITKMNKIVNTHAEINETIEGKIEENKTKIFSWRWKCTKL